MLATSPRGLQYQVVPKPAFQRNVPTEPPPSTISADLAGRRQAGSGQGFTPAADTAQHDGCNEKAEHCRKASNGMGMLPAITAIRKASAPAAPPTSVPPAESPSVTQSFRVREGLEVGDSDMEHISKVLCTIKRVTSMTQRRSSYPVVPNPAAMQLIDSSSAARSSLRCASVAAFPRTRRSSSICS